MLMFAGVGTPIKFKGKTEEELSKLSEEDQTEYLIYISQKEAATSAGREAVFVNEDEDEDLKAALEASLLEVNSPVVAEVSSHNVADSSGFRTPRKRHLSETTDSPPTKLTRFSPGVFTQLSSDNPVRREPTPTPDKMTSSSIVSSAQPDTTAAGIEAIGSMCTPPATPESGRKQSWKKSYHRPETQAEEEADMQRALELSTQDINNAELVSDQSNNTDQAPESSNVSQDDTDDGEEECEGPEEYCYKLSSIVSHFGATTAAGHYVADVYR